MILRLLLSLALIVATLPQVRIPGPGGAGTVAGVTWAVVQAKSNTAACTGTGISSKACTVNNAGQGLANTGVGNAIFVAVAWTDIVANTPSITSVVGDNGSDTVLTHCPTSPATGQIWKPATNVWYATDCYYILSSAGGTNSFTATVGFGASATSVGVDVYVVEISKSSGSITIDTEAAGNNGGSTCSACVVPSITFTGSNDYVLTWIAIDDQAGPPFGAASISGSYSNPFDNSDATDITAALAGKVNVTTYSAPTWTLQQTSFVSMSVIALK